MIVGMTENHLYSCKDAYNLMLRDGVLQNILATVELNFLMFKWLLWFSIAKVF